MLHVTAAVLERGGRILVARRTRPPELAGLWEFPGGKVEPGESPEASLARELVEELGIVVSVGRHLATSHFTTSAASGSNEISPAESSPAESSPTESSGSPGLALAAYEVELVSGEPHPDPADGTHDQVRWVTPAELLRLDLAPADVPIAEAIVTRCTGS